MRLTFGDLLRLHFGSLGLLDVLLLLLLLGECAAIVKGTIAYARRSQGADGPGRWSRAAVSIGMIAVVLAVMSLGLHHAQTSLGIAKHGANTTPADVSLHEAQAFLALMFGLLIAAVGLAGGWILEWFVDGREGDQAEPSSSVR